jgi:hypothetical protein
MMSRRRRLLLATVAFAGLLVVATAFASQRNGGNSIANAPALNPGKRVTGGGQMTDSAGKPNSGAEYWRVRIPAGGVFVADYGSLNGRNVYLNLYRPNESDFSIYNASSLKNAGSDGKEQMFYRAGVSGNYILQVSGDGDYGYELTSHIVTRSTVTLSGPKLIVPNRRGTVRGRVYGANGGSVTIQGLGSGGWREITTAYLGPNGGFKAQFTFTGRCRSGSWSTRAVYAGDDTHPHGVSNVLITRPGGCR